MRIHVGWEYFYWSPAALRQQFGSIVNPKAKLSFLLHNLNENSTLWWNKMECINYTKTHIDDIYSITLHRFNCVSNWARESRHKQLQYEETDTRCEKKMKQSNKIKVLLKVDLDVETKAEQSNNELIIIIMFLDACIAVSRADVQHTVTVKRNNNNKKLCTR